MCISIKRFKLIRGVVLHAEYCSSLLHLKLNRRHPSKFAVPWEKPCPPHRQIYIVSEADLNSIAHEQPIPKTPRIRIDLSGTMGSSKSKPKTPRGAFALFPKLPQEIQSQIWAHAAVDWTIEQLIYMTSPPTGNDKTVFFVHIGDTLGQCTCTPPGDPTIKRKTSAPITHFASNLHLCLLFPMQLAQ